VIGGPVVAALSGPVRAVTGSWLPGVGQEELVAVPTFGPVSWPGR
jgi:hypothetical protein